MTIPPKKESPRTSVSPSSGYLLYGRGTRDEYEREVQRVKTELRSEIYGSPDDEKKKSSAPKTDKKKTNAAAVIVFVATIISIVIAAVYAILIKTNALVGRDLSSAIAEFIPVVREGAPDVTFGVGLCACVATLFCLTTMIGAACSVKRARLGKLMLIGAILWTAALGALCGLILTEKSIMPIEAVVLTITAAIALIATAIGNKKPGGK